MLVSPLRSPLVKGSANPASSLTKRQGQATALPWRQVSNLPIRYRQVGNLPPREKTRPSGRSRLRCVKLLRLDRARRPVQRQQALEVIVAAHVVAANAVP